MADKSTYWRDAVLNALKGTPIAAITPRVSVHDADPGLTGANEIAGTTRQPVTFGALGDGGGGRQMANDVAVTFSAMPATTVRYAGVWDSAGPGGNFLYGDALAADQIVNAGGTFEIPIGDLTITER
jgi:hypothetical protein